MTESNKFDQIHLFKNGGCGEDSGQVLGGYLHEFGKI